MKDKQNKFARFSESDTPLSELSVAPDKAWRTDKEGFDKRLNEMRDERIKVIIFEIDTIRDNTEVYCDKELTTKEVETLINYLQNVENVE